MCSNNAAFVITLAAVRRHSSTFDHTQSNFFLRKCSSSISPRRLTPKQSWNASPDATSSTKTSVSLFLTTPSLHILTLTLKANAISHRDHLEFLEDVAPKTITFKKAKAAAQARSRGERLPDADSAAAAAAPRATTNGSGSGKGSKANGGSKTAAVNGQAKAGSNPFTLSLRGEDKDSKKQTTATTEDPNDQLELEMRQAAQPEADDADVDMTG